MLVIEDQQDIANLMRLHLEDLPCAVELAFDGRSGLAAAHDESGVSAYFLAQSLDARQLGRPAALEQLSELLAGEAAGAKSGSAELSRNLV